MTYKYTVRANNIEGLRRQVVKLEAMNWQNANKDQGFVEMIHEKKKMTRKEAIECFRQHMPDVVKAENTIDFYIEAGMLEIVEEHVLTCDHVDDRLMIIKRHGKIIYDETK